MEKNCGDTYVLVRVPQLFSVAQRSLAHGQQKQLKELGHECAVQVFISLESSRGLESPLSCLALRWGKDGGPVTASLISPPVSVWLPLCLFKIKGPLSYFLPL